MTGPPGLRGSVDPASRVAAVVLAAGLGRRFGGAKLTAILGTRPLIDHVLETLARAMSAGALDHVVVVHGAGKHAGPDAATVRELALARGFQPVANDDPRAGMSRSISLGLAALETRRAGAALVALGDQPATRLDVIERLVATWRAARPAMLVPRYGIGGAGNPVIVAREIWPMAATLRGDRGLRAVVDGRPDLAAYLDVEGANPDVDDAAGLAAVGSASE